MTKLKPLDPYTLLRAADYVARRRLTHRFDSWDAGYNDGMAAAARHLRTLATEQAHALKPAKRTKR